MPGGQLLVALLAAAAAPHRVGRPARQAPSILMSQRSPATAGGQPGGRVGCCYKSASYLDNLVAAPRPPADREAALANLRAALGAGACSLTDVLEFAAEHATYAPQPFRAGDVQAASGERATAATALALLKLAHATRAEAERALAQGAACAAPADREVYEAFAQTGWEGVDFPGGLPLAWRVAVDY